MAELLPHLWLFVSIAGPHLGQLFGDNTLLRAGLVFLNAVAQGSCLHQLDMSEWGSKAAVSRSPLASSHPPDYMCGPKPLERVNICSLRVHCVWMCHNKSKV